MSLRRRLLLLLSARSPLQWQPWWRLATHLLRLVLAQLYRRLPLQPPLLLSRVLVLPRLPPPLLWLPLLPLLQP